ncbi:MAG: hypothetical protein ISS44_02250, partial [Candidatus Omnitrophica bacterium]|nr:hypothetical protein [Candidatus Omnitrophota bacterium]
MQEKRTDYNGGKGENLDSSIVYIGKPAFKSSFKTWIRIVAFVIVAVFLPQQVAQAVEYDWRVLWQRPTTSTFNPSYLKDITSINIPLAIKRILTDISGKDVNAIKLSSNLILELEKPLNLSKEKIEEIYEWLRGKPCGSKALYDFLRYKGVSVYEEDVAVLALSIDILNDVVKPEGEPEVIKNSLYALSQASDFFGHKLYPVKIETNAITQEPYSAITPFIAHLKGDHYILVTKISQDKVYFLDEHNEEFLPVERFLEQFSGYALIKGQSPAGTVPIITVITDNEAKSILGARKRRGGGFDWGKWATQLGITVVTTVVLSGLKVGTEATKVAQTKNSLQWSGFGGRVGWGLSSQAWQGISQSLSRNMAYLYTAKTVVNIGQMAGWKPSTTRLIAGAIGGGVMGLAGGLGNLVAAPSAFGKFATGAAIGLTQTSVTELAIDKWNMSPSIASFVSTIPAMVVGSALNTKFGGYTPESIDKQYKIYEQTHPGITRDQFIRDVQRLPMDGFAPNQWATAGFKHVWNHVWSNGTAGPLLVNGITIGLEEVIRRNTNIDPAYNSMVGAAMRPVVSGLLNHNNTELKWHEAIGQAIGQGIVEAGLSYGVAHLEKSLNFDNPFMEAFVASSLMATARGVLFSLGAEKKFQGIKEPGGLVNPTEISERKPSSLFENVIGSTFSHWQEAGLRTLSLGYYGREESFFGEMTYFTNLLDFTYNASQLGFGQAMVMYGTDVYHYAGRNILSEIFDGVRTGAFYVKNLEEGSLEKIIKLPHKRSIILQDPDSGLKLSQQADIRSWVAYSLDGRKSTILAFSPESKATYSIVSSKEELQKAIGDIENLKKKEFIQEIALKGLKEVKFDQANWDETGNYKAVLLGTGSQLTISPRLLLDGKDLSELPNDNLNKIETIGGIDIKIDKLIGGINLSEGEVGILVTADNRGNLRVDHNSPTYSEGAKWKILTRFEERVDGAATTVDALTGIHFSSDTWLGYLKGQKGNITIGENNFTGDAFLIKEYKDFQVRLAISDREQGTANIDVGGEFSGGLSGEFGHLIKEEGVLGVTPTLNSEIVENLGITPARNVALTINDKTVLNSFRIAEVEVYDAKTREQRKESPYEKAYIVGGEGDFTVTGFKPSDEETKEIRVLQSKWNAYGHDTKEGKRFYTQETIPDKKAPRIEFELTESRFNEGFMARATWQDDGAQTFIEKDNQLTVNGLTLKPGTIYEIKDGKISPTKNKVDVGIVGFRVGENKPTVGLLAGNSFIGRGDTQFATSLVLNEERELPLEQTVNLNRVQIISLINPSENQLRSGQISKQQAKDILNQLGKEGDSQLLLQDFWKDKNPDAQIPEKIEAQFSSKITLKSGEMPFYRTPQDKAVSDLPNYLGSGVYVRPENVIASPEYKYEVSVDGKTFGSGTGRLLIENGKIYADASKGFEWFNIPTTLGSSKTSVPYEEKIRQSNTSVSFISRFSEGKIPVLTLGELNGAFNTLRGDFQGQVNVDVLHFQKVHFGDQEGTYHYNMLTLLKGTGNLTYGKEGDSYIPSYSENSKVSYAFNTLSFLNNVAELKRAQELKPDEKISSVYALGVYSKDQAWKAVATLDGKTQLIPQLRDRETPEGTFDRYLEIENDKLFYENIEGGLTVAGVERKVYDEISKMLRFSSDVENVRFIRNNLVSPTGTKLTKEGIAQEIQKGIENTTLISNEEIENKIKNDLQSALAELKKLEKSPSDGQLGEIMAEHIQPVLVKLAESLKEEFNKDPDTWQSRHYQTIMKITSPESVKLVSEDGKITWIEEGSGKLGLGADFSGNLRSLAGFPGTIFDVRNRTEENPFVVYQANPVKIEEKEITPYLTVWGDGTDKRAQIHIDPLLGIFGDKAPTTRFEQVNVISKNIINGNNKYVKEGSILAEITQRGAFRDYFERVLTEFISGGIKEDKGETFRLNDRVFKLVKEIATDWHLHKSEKDYVRNLWSRLHSKIGEEGVLGKFISYLRSERFYLAAQDKKFEQKLKENRPIKDFMHIGPKGLLLAQEVKVAGEIQGVVTNLKDKSLIAQYKLNQFAAENGHLKAIDIECSYWIPNSVLEKFLDLTQKDENKNKVNPAQISPTIANLRSNREGGVTYKLSGGEDKLIFSLSNFTPQFSPYGEGTKLRLLSTDVFYAGTSIKTEEVMLNEKSLFFPINDNNPNDNLYIEYRRTNPDDPYSVVPHFMADSFLKYIHDLEMTGEVEVSLPSPTGGKELIAEGEFLEDAPLRARGIMWSSLDRRRFVGSEDSMDVWGKFKTTTEINGRQEVVVAEFGRWGVKRAKDEATGKEGIISSGPVLTEGEIALKDVSEPVFWRNILKEKFNPAVVRVFEDSSEDYSDKPGSISLGIDPQEQGLLMHSSQKKGDGELISHNLVLGLGGKKGWSHLLLFEGISEGGIQFTSTLAEKENHLYIEENSPVLRSVVASLPPYQKHGESGSLSVYYSQDSQGRLTRLSGELGDLSWRNGVPLSPNRAKGARAKDDQPRLERSPDGEWYVFSKRSIIPGSFKEKHYEIWDGDRGWIPIKAKDVHDKKGGGLGNLVWGDVERLVRVPVTGETIKKWVDNGDAKRAINRYDGKVRSAEGASEFYLFYHEETQKWIPVHKDDGVIKEKGGGHGWAPWKWGLWNLASDDKEVRIRDSKGQEFIRCMDEDKIKSLKEEYFKNPGKLSYHNAEWRYINRNNYTIYDGDRIYYVDGKRLTPYLNQAHRLDNRALEPTLLHLMEVNKYASDLSKNITIFTGETVVTLVTWALATLLTPTEAVPVVGQAVHGTSIAAAVATTAATANTARKIWGVTRIIQAAKATHTIKRLSSISALVKTVQAGHNITKISALLSLGAMGVTEGISEYRYGEHADPLALLKVGNSVYQTTALIYLAGYGLMHIPQLAHVVNTVNNSLNIIKGTSTGVKVANELFKVGVFTGGGVVGGNVLGWGKDYLQGKSIDWFNWDRTLAGGTTGLILYLSLPGGPLSRAFNSWANKLGSSAIRGSYVSLANRQVFIPLTLRTFPYHALKGLTYRAAQVYTMQKLIAAPTFWLLSKAASLYNGTDYDLDVLAQWMSPHKTDLILFPTLGLTGQLVGAGIKPHLGTVNKALGFGKGFKQGLPNTLENLGRLIGHSGKGWYFSTALRGWGGLGLHGLRISLLQVPILGGSWAFDQLDPVLESLDHSGFLPEFNKNTFAAFNQGLRKNNAMELAEKELEGGKDKVEEIARKEGFNGVIETLMKKKGATGSVDGFLRKNVPGLTFEWGYDTNVFKVGINSITLFGEIDNQGFSFGFNKRALFNYIYGAFFYGFGAPIGKGMANIKFLNIGRVIQYAGNIEGAISGRLAQGMQGKLGKTALGSKTATVINGVLGAIGEECIWEQAAEIFTGPIIGLPIASFTGDPRLGALASEIVQEVIFGEGGGSRNYINKAGKAALYQGPMPAAKDLVGLIGKSGPQVRKELVHLRDTSGKNYFTNMAEVDEFIAFLQYRGRITPNGEVGYIGKLAINSAAEAEAVNGGVPVPIAADGARGVIPERVQQIVDKRVAQLERKGTRPEVHSGNKYEIREYIDKDAQNFLGREGMGYTRVDSSGKKVTVLVHNGTLDTRLHEIAELRVNRQTELIREGKLQPSQELKKGLKITEELSKLNKTTLAHEYVQSILGYKATSQGKVNISTKEQLPKFDVFNPQLTRGPPSSVSVSQNIGIIASDGFKSRQNSEVKTNPDNDKKVNRALRVAEVIAENIGKNLGLPSQAIIETKVKKESWNPFTKIREKQENKIKGLIEEGYTIALGKDFKETQPKVNPRQIAFTYDLTESILKGEHPVEGLDLGEGKTLAVKVAFYAAIAILQAKYKKGILGFNMPYMNLLEKAIEETPELLNEMAKAMRIELVKQAKETDQAELPNLTYKVIKEGPKNQDTPFVLRLYDSDTLEYIAQEITHKRMNHKVLTEVRHWHLDELTDSLGRPNRIMAMAEAWKNIKDNPEARKSAEEWAKFVRRFVQKMEESTKGRAAEEIFTNPVDPRVNQENPRHRIFKANFVEKLYALYEKMRSEIPESFAKEFGIGNKKGFLKLANLWADSTKYRLGNIYSAPESPLGYTTADPFGGSFEKTHLPDNFQSAIVAYNMARIQGFSEEDTTRVIVNALLSKETERISFIDVLKMIKKHASYMTATTRKYEPLYRILGVTPRIFSERSLINLESGKLKVSGAWTQEETINKLLEDISDNGADAQAVFGNDWELIKEAVDKVKQTGYNVEFIDGSKVRTEVQGELNALRQRIKNGEKMIVFIMGSPIGSNIFELSKKLGTAATHQITLAGRTDLTQFLGRAATQGRKGPRKGKPAWYLTICLSRDNQLTESQRLQLRMLVEQGKHTEVAKALLGITDQLDLWDVLEARDRVAVIKFIKATPKIMAEISKKFGLSEKATHEISVKILKSNIQDQLTKAIEDAKQRGLLNVNDKDNATFNYSDNVETNNLCDQHKAKISILKQLFILSSLVQPEKIESELKPENLAQKVKDLTQKIYEARIKQEQNQAQGKDNQQQDKKKPEPPEEPKGPSTKETKREETPIVPVEPTSTKLPAARGQGQGHYIPIITPMLHLWQGLVNLARPNIAYAAQESKREQAGTGVSHLTRGPTINGAAAICAIAGRAIEQARNLWSKLVSYLYKLGFGLSNLAEGESARGVNKEEKGQKQGSGGATPVGNAGSTEETKGLSSAGNGNGKGGSQGITGRNRQEERPRLIERIKYRLHKLPLKILAGNQNARDPPIKGRCFVSKLRELLRKLFVIPQRKNFELVHPASLRNFLESLKGKNPTILGSLLGFLTNDGLHIIIDMLRKAFHKTLTHAGNEPGVNGEIKEIEARFENLVKLEEKKQDDRQGTERKIALQIIRRIIELKLKKKNTLSKDTPKEIDEITNLIKALPTEQKERFQRRFCAYLGPYSKIWQELSKEKPDLREEIEGIRKKITESEKEHRKDKDKKAKRGEVRTMWWLDELEETQRKLKQAEEEKKQAEEEKKQAEEEKKQAEEKLDKEKQARIEAEQKRKTAEKKAEEYKEYDEQYAPWWEKIIDVAKNRFNFRLRGVERENIKELLEGTINIDKMSELIKKRRDQITAKLHDEGIARSRYGEPEKILPHNVAYYEEQAEREIIEEVTKKIIERVSKMRDGRLRAQKEKWLDSLPLPEGIKKILKKIGLIREDDLKEIEGKTASEAEKIIKGKISKVWNQRNLVGKIKNCLLGAVFHLGDKIGGLADALKLRDILKKLGWDDGHLKLRLFFKACKEAGLDLVGFRTSLEEFKVKVVRFSGRLIVVYRRKDGTWHAFTAKGINKEGDVYGYSDNHFADFQSVDINPSELADESGEVILIAESEVKEGFEQKKDLTEEDLDADPNEINGVNGGGAGNPGSGSSGNGGSGMSSPADGEGDGEGGVDEDKILSYGDGILFDGDIIVILSGGKAIGIFGVGDSSKTGKKKEGSQRKSTGRISRKRGTGGSDGATVRGAILNLLEEAGIKISSSDAILIFETLSRLLYSTGPPVGRLQTNLISSLISPTNTPYSILIFSSYAKTKRIDCFPLRFARGHNDRNLKGRVFPDCFAVARNDRKDASNELDNYSNDRTQGQSLQIYAINGINGGRVCEGGVLGFLKGQELLFLRLESPVQPLDLQTYYSSL